jgi:Fur family ferric uptake transcriptional regulator
MGIQDMKTSDDQILKAYRLRSTASRSDILRLFVQRGYALSYSDIEKEISSTYDRVTVYRTLKTFVDKGVVHKVLDNEGVLKYALCNDHCSHTEHHHEHTHFKCLRCGHTECITDANIPAVVLPKGYQAREFNLLIQGICPKCE